MKPDSFKGPPKKNIYWSYKIFDSECFRNALQEELETLGGDELTNVLNSHAYIKTIIMRINNNVFMTKESRKEIMKRWKLRNIFNKQKS